MASLPTMTPPILGPATAGGAEAAAALKDILDNLLAPAILGVICDAWWVGIICALCYRYYRNFPRDRLVTKMLVPSVLLLISRCILASMVHYYFFKSFGQPIRLSVAIWEWTLHIGLLALVAFCVQMFYAHRLYTLSGGNYIMAGIVLVLSTIGFGFGLASMAMIFKLRSFAELPAHTWIVVIWLTFSASCDIFISSTQVFYLLRCRNGLARTNKMVNVLILYVLGSGLFMSLDLILQLILFAVMGYNYLTFFLSYQTTAIRSLSLLANLSVRQRVRNMDQTTDFVVPPMSESAPVRVGVGGRVVTPIVFEKADKTVDIVADFSPSNSSAPGMRSGSFLDPSTVQESAAGDDHPSKGKVTTPSL